MKSLVWVLSLLCPAAFARQACEAMAVSGAAQRGPVTRGITPRYPVRLSQKLTGARCDAGGFTAATAWPAEKVQHVERRLGSLD